MLGQIRPVGWYVWRSGRADLVVLAAQLGVGEEVAERYKRIYGVTSEDGHYRPLTSESDVVDESRR